MLSWFYFEYFLTWCDHISQKNGLEERWKKHEIDTDCVAMNGNFVEPRPSNLIKVGRT
jgi:hypothetical protein